MGLYQFFVGEAQGRELMGDLLFFFACIFGLGCVDFLVLCRGFVRFFGRDTL